MSIEGNDPRLTSYALGEMNDTDRAAFEAELDDSVRAEIEAIRNMAGRVEGELSSQPALGLTDDQRGKIERATAPRDFGPVLLFVAAAATLLVGVSLFAMLLPKSQMSSEKLNATNRRMQDAYDINAFAKPSKEITGYDEGGDGRAGGGNGGGGGAAEAPFAGPSKERNVPAALASSIFHFDGAAKPKAVNLPRRVDDLRRVIGRAPPNLNAEDPNPREAYDRIQHNEFKRAIEEHTSTLSIDVDTASYANVRRYLNGGSLPPPDAVRIEEMINYFSYEYAPPQKTARHPFSAHVEIAACPWKPQHRLARIALKGKTMDQKERPPTNLVFLLDVSGSMSSADKLPLLVQSMKLLVARLGKNDKVAIVVYAGAAGLVLDSTTCDEKATINQALDRLKSGGSTAGAAGIQLAYDVAKKNFIKQGVNRVILATDGDFNVGISDRGGLTRLIEARAKTGVFLSILGFGTGNYKDATMEELSNRGNGNYAYIDTLKEGRKVLVEQLAGTLVTIAKDVKIQIFFNPKKVEAYRLIGYENRLLAKEDFNDDKKDAGEIGAGHAVTALYEIVPVGVEMPTLKVDPNPFVAKAKPSPLADSDAWFRLRLRYKHPDGDDSTLMEKDVKDEGKQFDRSTADFQWASSVAAFGMVLRNSPHKGDANLKAILEIAKSSKGNDPHGYRAEFLELVERAMRLSRRK